MPTHFSLTKCQKEALDQLQSGANVFLTGKAGTGKSTLLSHYLLNKETRYEYPILASTGASAVLVKGRTFHSFFGLGVMAGSFKDVVAKALKSRHVKHRLKKAKTVVIDEISMLSGTTLQAAEEIARLARKQDMPWGGLRVIAVGDFAQLPPTPTGGKRDWAFLHGVWKQSFFNPVTLETVVRTKDSDFIALLNEVREGHVTQELISFFEERTRSPQESHNFDGTRLFPLRRSTEGYNLERLSQLSGQKVHVMTEYSGSEPFIEHLMKHAPVPEILSLKIGALVMIRVNDPLLKYVNGSVGKVIDITEDKIKVALPSHTVDLERMTFSYLNGDGDPLAQATNFPLTLAWASTIHKAQGSTLDRVLLDLKGLWEPGHAYVALSRASSADGVFISRWSPSGIHSDPAVSEFYRQGCPSDFMDHLEFSQMV